MFFLMLVCWVGGLGLGGFGGRPSVQLVISVKDSPTVKDMALFNKIVYIETITLFL